MATRNKVARTSWFSSIHHKKRPTLTSKPLFWQGWLDSLLSILPQNSSPNCFLPNGNTQQSCSLLIQIQRLFYDIKSPNIAVGAIFIWQGWLDTSPQGYDGLCKIIKARQKSPEPVGSHQSTTKKDLL